ncbi:MAG: hypothetical protein C4K58_04620 [Flavobacteriaceae bacterium]|nr:MAG: hypothetical protein C4K58_04620 [Flavobacteriaceae bacterium]
MENWQEIIQKSGYLNLDNALYSKVNPTELNQAKLLGLNASFIEKNLKLNPKDENWKSLLAGEIQIENSFSMAYSGHQFGHYVPQLGDGRAINVGQVGSWQLQLKGAGLTPYSRMGDGLAVLRSSIREFLMAEYMHAIGIPSSRSVGIVASFSQLAQRETLEPTSIVMRASPSWIRFGSFQYAGISLGKKKLVQQLTELSFSQGFPKQADTSGEHLFSLALENTAQTLAKWQAYGFMHGVMNTDNFSILGLTIDYGPFGMMDTFSWNHSPNTSDYNGRYRYSMQPIVGKWNLEKLSEALGVAYNKDRLEKKLEDFYPSFQKHLTQALLNRLGLDLKQEDSTQKLLESWFMAMEESSVDFNGFFVFLTFEDPLDTQKLKQLCGKDLKPIENWIQRYLRLEPNKEKMKKYNPVFVPKNYMLQKIIKQCSLGDFEVLQKWLSLCQNPFLMDPILEEYKGRSPENTDNYRLSCSS